MSPGRSCLRPGLRRPALDGGRGAGVKGNRGGARLHVGVHVNVPSYVRMNVLSC